MLTTILPRATAGAWTLRLAALVALLTATLAPALASAHEHREVGKHELVVGFQNEPSYVNQPNGIWVKVTEPAAGGEQAEGKPVEGLEKTLKAEVISGDDKMSVPLRAAFGEPGVYLGDFIPTKVGDYQFHFTGTVAGQALDETFESGPGRFDSVKSVVELQFPDKQPSTSELQTSLQEARNAASQARDAASQARTVGYVGIGVGALGLLAALAALAMRGRRGGTAPVARSGSI